MKKVWSWYCSMRASFSIISARNPLESGTSQDSQFPHKNSHLKVRRKRAFLILRTEMLPFHLLSLSLTPEYIYISPILIMTTISNISLEILTQEKDNVLLPHQESMTFHTRAGRSSLLPRLNKFSVEIIVEMQSFSWFNCCWHADLTALAS